MIVFHFRRPLDCYPANGRHNAEGFVDLASLLCTYLSFHQYVSLCFRKGGELLKLAHGIN